MIGRPSEASSRVGERARHRDALALAAGKLVRPLVHVVGEAERGEQIAARACAWPRPTGAPSARIGSMTLSRMVNSGSRKWNWNTKPSWVSRVRARSSSSICTVARPWISTSPVVGRSSRPSRYSSEDLPEPDGPVIATNSLSAMRKLMSCTSVVGTMPGRMRVTLRASISARSPAARLRDLRRGRAHVAPRMISTGLPRAALRAG